PTSSKPSWTAGACRCLAIACTSLPPIRWMRRSARLPTSSPPSAFACCRHARHASRSRTSSSAWSNRPAWPGRWRVRIDSFKRVIAQTRKELTELLRDRLAIALALLLPLLQLALLGSSFALIVRDLPIIVQDFDDSTASRQLVDQFRGSLTFRILPWPTDRKPDAAFANGQARGGLVIPEDFGRNLARGMNADVQIIVDGSDANTAKLVSGYAGGVVRSFNQAHSSGPMPAGGVMTAIRFWYNPSLSSQKFYAPGIFV